MNPRPMSLEEICWSDLQSVRDATCIALGKRTDAKDAQNAPEQQQGQGAYVLLRRIQRQRLGRE